MSYPPNTIPQNGDDQQITLKKILLALTTAFPGVFAGLTDAQLRATPVPVSGTLAITEPTVTRHSILLDSGGTASQLIPTGAKGYSFTVITGTASDGTASGLPAGFSNGDVNTLAAGFTVTASGGTTFVAWNT